MSDNPKIIQNGQERRVSSSNSISNLQAKATDKNYGKNRTNIKLASLNPGAYRISFEQFQKKKIFIPISPDLPLIWEDKNSHVENGNPHRRAISGSVNKNKKNTGKFILNSRKNTPNWLQMNENKSKKLTWTSQNNHSIQSGFPKIKPEDIGKKCFYCLTQITSPKALPCSDELCSSCLKEFLNITEYIKRQRNDNLDTNSFQLQCLKCKTLIPDSFNKEINFNSCSDIIEYLPESPIKCSQCSLTSPVYECWNCDLLLCSNCHKSHYIIPLYQHHKSVPYKMSNSSDITKCKIHGLPFEYFCVDDNTHICSKCYDIFHNDHCVESIIECTGHYRLSVINEIEKGKENLGKIRKIISDMEIRDKQWDKEHDYFSQELNKHFNDIWTVIMSHKKIMINQLTYFYTDKKGKLNNEKDNLRTMLRRYEHYISFSMLKLQTNFIDPLNNLDRIQLVQNISWLNNAINNSISFDKYTTMINTFSYKSLSSFLNPPIKKIATAISKFSFLFWSKDGWDVLKTVFEKSSIITSNLITTNWLIVLPKFLAGEWLYKVSELGPSPEWFHELCDNKGPTITWVKTANGHIFGGFTEMSYVSDYKYDSGKQSFWFSITDGKIRKPMRCKIIKPMKEFAIKQSGRLHSPGYGLTDKSDLFIAYKDWVNSYSMWNNVYKCPKGYNSKTFLAGIEKNWSILDIEIYAIDYISDNNFYMLN